MATEDDVERYRAEMAKWFTDYSGPGSKIDFTQPYRRFIERFIIENQIKSIVDLGCGDMEVMGHVKLHNASYVGYDIVEERVQKNRLKCPHLMFQCGDIRSCRPRSDLVLVKDVIQHWPTADIVAWLANIRECDVRFILVTNCNYGVLINGDAPIGGWRSIDLTKPPFEVGEVVFSWGDDKTPFQSPNKDVVMIRGQR